MHNANKATTSGELTTQDVKALSWSYCGRLAVELAKHGVLSIVEASLRVTRLAGLSKVVYDNVRAVGKFKQRSVWDDYFAPGDQGAELRGWHGRPLTTKSPFVCYRLANHPCCSPSCSRRRCVQVHPQIRADVSCGKGHRRRIVASHQHGKTLSFA